MAKNGRGETPGEEFIAEAMAAPVPFGWKGRTYLIPAGMPAIYVLEVMRLRRSGGDNAEIPPERVFEILDDLVGPELLDQIVRETDTQATEIIDLFRAVMAVKRGEAAPSPNRAARRAAGKTTKKPKAPTPIRARR